MYRIILVFIIALLHVSQLSAAGDPDIKKGWDYFAQNKYKEAETHFKKALNGQNKAEAHLALSIIGAATNNDQMATEHQYQFYKTSKNPEPYIEALWSIWEGSDKEIMLQFLNDMSLSEDGKLQAMANQALGLHYRNTNKLSKSEEFYKKTGAITQWQVLGEFENISESGFDKDHGAVDHPEPNFPFKNKHGADVYWFDIKAPLFNNWIDLEYYFNGTNSIIYAQNYCQSPRDQDVQFRIGTSGSLKVWLNDKLLFSESEERNNDLDTYIFTARLLKGNNRILIQIGSSEIDESNFLLRITNSKGIPVEGLTFATSPRSYPKDYNFESEVINSATEKFLIKRTTDNPDALQEYLALIHFYLTNQMTYKAKRNLKVAREKFPDCSYVTMQLAWAHAQDNNRTEFSKCLEEIKTKDPDFPLAMDELFDEAVSIKNYREAKNILEKIEKRDPGSVDVYLKKIELASANEEYEELIELIMEAYQEYPDNYDFVSLRVAVEKEVKNNPKGAIKILTKFIKGNLNESAINDLIDLYLNLGQISKAIDLLNKRVERIPIAVSSYHKLYEIYFYTSDYKKAEELIKECIKIAPYIGGYHVSLGEALAEMKETARAKESYETAIYYNPQNYDAREKLRKLKGLEDIFDSFEKVDVYEAYKTSPDASAYPDDNSIILLDVVQKVVYPEGGSQEKRILVAKALNTKGVDTWKEFVIPIYNNQNAIIEKMEVLKKNGSKIEAQRSGAHVAFPDLEEGDAIHLTWKVSDYYSGILSRNFWAMHYFNYLVPVAYSNYSLLVPKEKDFKYLAQNIDLEPVISNVEASKLYIWKAENRPAIRDERYMPVLSEVGSVLHISSFDNWNTISKWYADLAHAKAKVDFEIRETVNSIFEGKEGLSDEEKVKEIYNYILRNIRYSSVPFIQSAMIPMKASRTLSQKQGDCKDVSTLFVAMCKAKDIDANIVLVNTREYGVNRMPLPGISFNHAIAKVTLDNKDYYIELTSDNLPFSAGLGSVKNVFALEIPIDKSEVVDAIILNPATRIRNGLIRKTTVTFKDDLMEVSKENWRTGVEAAYFRDIYKDLGDERQEKKMQESITGNYPKIKLTGFKFDKSLNNLDDTLSYSFSYEVPSIFTEIGKMHIFELPWSDKFDNPPFMATDERKFPIELWNYLDVETYQEELIINIPTGKKLTEVPKNITISCHNADYTLTYRRAGNQLFVKRMLMIKEDQVKPENYVEFKKFIGDVVKADKKQIGFTI